MRATAQDMDASAIMGINVNRTISFTFLIAGSLAGAAGLVYALAETTVRFDQGFQLGLIAFTSAVLGGIGNLPGAVLGAVLIGMIQACNEGFTWYAPGIGLDAVDRLLDPDPDPRLPSRRPARRTDTGRRVMAAVPRPGGAAEPAAGAVARAAADRALGDRRRLRARARDRALVPRSLARLRRRRRDDRHLAAEAAAGSVASGGRGRDRRSLRDRLGRRVDERVDRDLARDRVRALLDPRLLPPLGAARPRAADRDRLPVLRRPHVHDPGLRLFPGRRHGRGDHRVRDDGVRPEHRGRLRRPARPRLRRLLRDRRLHRGLVHLGAVRGPEMPDARRQRRQLLGRSRAEAELRPRRDRRPARHGRLPCLGLAAARCSPG